MGKQFEGCIEAREISLTRKGANQHAHVLIKKSLDDKPQPAETDVMDAKLMKSLLAMKEVTKAYAVGLEDDKFTAFMAKSLEDQDKEASDAAKAVSDAEKAAKDKEDAEKAAIGAAGVAKTATELALEKRLEESQAQTNTVVGQLAEINKRLLKADLEKRADSEFKGYPGGTAEVVKRLEDIAALPEEARKSIEGDMKRTIELARTATVRAGFTVTEEELEKRAPATARIEKAAKELAAAKSIPYEDAWEQVIEKKEFAADVAAMQAESN